MALLLEYISHIASIVNLERTSTSIFLGYLVVNFRIWNSSVFLPATLMCLVLALMYMYLEPRPPLDFRVLSLTVRPCFCGFPLHILKNNTIEQQYQRDHC